MTRMNGIFRLGMAALSWAWLSACELGISPGGGTGAEGVIVDPSGSPLPGVRVWLHPAGNGALPKASAALAAARARAESTLTDAEGKYRFRNASRGTYNLQASRRAGDTTYALFVGNVALSKSFVDLGADTLRVSGSLRVAVRDALGAPVAGAVCAVAGSSWRAESDAQGECLLEGVAPGAYRLEVLHAGQTASGTVVVTSGFESGSTVRFVPGSEPAVQAWRTYAFEGYRFQGPPDLKPSPRVDGIDSWSETFANDELAVTQSGGMVVPPGDQEPQRKREIPWSDSSRGILRMFLDSAGDVRSAQLTFAILRAGLWEERAGLFWTGAVASPAAWVQVEKILASLRPMELWSGPLPESAEEVRVSPLSAGLPGGIQWNAVAWNGTRFATVGTQGAIATSADGLNWTYGFTGRKEEFTSVTVTPSGFLAVGRDSVGMASIAAFEDERTVIVNSAVSAPGSKFYGVAWGHDRLVAVNYDGVWSSDNGGSSWTARVSGYPVFSVTWTGTQFVAVGYLGGNGHVRVVTSPDGVSWTQRFAGSATAGVGWNAVAASGDRIVATGQGLYGDMGVSTNGGLSWTVKKPEGMNIVSLARAWNRFVGVGSHEGRPAIWTSSDGDAWKRQPLESSVGSGFLGVAASPWRLVVVGEGIAATP
jgi:hypothetical protein